LLLSIFGCSCGTCELCISAIYRAPAHAAVFSPLSIENIVQIVLAASVADFRDGSHVYAYEYKLQQLFCRVKTESRKPAHAVLRSEFQVPNTCTEYGN
jgi:hypothetical protein